MSFSNNPLMLFPSKHDHDHVINVTVFHYDIRIVVEIELFLIGQTGVTKGLLFLRDQILLIELCKFLLADL